MPRQLLEERQPRTWVELVIAVEQLARHRGTGGFAAAGQQCLAKPEQLGGVLLAVSRGATAQQRSATPGNGGEKLGKKGVGHGCGSNPEEAESYIGFRVLPILFKRMDRTEICHGLEV